MTNQNNFQQKLTDSKNPTVLEPTYKHVR